MPSYDHLETNLLDPPSFDWLKGVLEVIETLDAGAYAALMRDDGELRMPDGSTLHGPAEVERVLTAQFAAVTSIDHQDLRLYGSQHHIVHEARVVVTLTDGTSTTSTQTSWIDADDEGHITSARVYA